MPKQNSLSSTSTIAVSIALGLIAGYLDVAILVLRKYTWSPMRTFGSGSDFPWSVPIGHVVLLLMPGLILAAINRTRRWPVSLRAGSWLLATLALWSALLRLPLYGYCSLFLAAGLARPVSAAISRFVVQQTTIAWRSWAGLIGVLVLLGSLSTGWRVIREHRAVAALPAPPAAARNVLLIVWDTVRASSLSLYGYPRDTTPNLVQWARQGVRFDQALSTAPWTFPSHASFMTGQWPYVLNAQWNHTLDTAHPTLAECLVKQGYETAGFVANINYCGYETKLNRGFIHYEDYPVTPWSLFNRTIGGSWILKNLVSRNDFSSQKWLNFQSRDGRAINDAFLGWLAGRRQDRPFFAFLNYFDAHDPYLAPAGFEGRFGIRPTSPRDYQYLLDFSTTVTKSNIAVRDILMARDCYDNCITFLDDQLGRLLSKLQAQGLLQNTVVVITADHGESFGYHGVFGHGASLYMDEIGVPLVILSPSAPRGGVVAQPVSLRDLPATLMDQVGLSAESPFPGRSLAVLWRPKPGQAPLATTPALSEMAPENAAAARSERGLSRRFQMSLVASGRHYVRDGAGGEQLYDLARDSFETADLAARADTHQALRVFRKSLLNLLKQDPSSIEVENACLGTFKESLRALVEAGDALLREPEVSGPISGPS